MSRLSIEIDQAQHRQMKILATFAGWSIKDHILQKTLAPQSNTQDATNHLLASPQNARQLRGAIHTSRSEHVVFESLQELEHALGI